MPSNKLDVKTLESWLWEAACKIRGEIDAPKYKREIWVHRTPLAYQKRQVEVK